MDDMNKMPDPVDYEKVALDALAEIASNGLENTENRIAAAATLLTLRD